MSDQTRLGRVIKVMDDQTPLESYRAFSYQLLYGRNTDSSISVSFNVM